MSVFEHSSSVKFIDMLRRKGSLAKRLWIGYSLLLVISFVDFLTGYYLGFFVFYYIPIVIIILSSKRNNILFVSMLCTALWCLSDYFSKGGNIMPHFFAWNTCMRFFAFSFVGIILYALRISLEREQMLARKDALTGVWNRYSFEDFAKREVAKSRRFNRPLTIAYIDCDNFKGVNDTLGHSSGDDCLKAMSETIEHNIRSVDLIARLGGDEFILLLSETGSVEAKIVIERVMACLRAAMAKNGWKTTFSIGVVTYAAGVVRDVSHIIEDADKSMYEAKKTGKNKVNYVCITA